ncbi:MAG: hypothetical protein COA50_05505 [Flavobacteriaceae bacterium]|nr:MAG: hypothetical protein COA50_05505 [Flavobacteriaceae bacterium]
MKKHLIIAVLTVCALTGCGIIIDTSEEKNEYTYILKNETGQSLQITSDFGRMELIPDGEAFKCIIYSAPSGFQGGLCSGELEIRIPETNKGYRCHGYGVASEGLCFLQDNKVFTISDNTIFTEISSRTYEYVLTPELLERTYELPEE